MYVATMRERRDDALGQDFVAFIHAFGLLRTDATPCGQPMSVSTAHAVCELATQGPLNQKDLSDRLGLDASSVSRLVDQLTKKQWAQRCVDPNGLDKRVRLITLTDQGQQIASNVLTARAQRFGRLIEAVDESKRHQVLESLNLLKDAAHAIQ